MQLNQQEFFETYNIDTQEFNTAEISWNSLLEIHSDYLSYKETLIPTAEHLSAMLRTHPASHTVRSRVKDAEHLIDKIIRKIIREKKNNSDYNIDIKNYKSEITDLIGIRVIHLYKDQAVSIDEFIRDTWELKETPTIYYRQGDYSKQEEYQDNESFNFKVHPFGYRSWHYLIGSQATKNIHIAEIQVRTIFEEGWSEIDHKLRYPNHTNDIHLTKQLLVLNRVAGSADEMATVIRELTINTREIEAETLKKQETIEELKAQVESLAKDYNVEKNVTETLTAKIQELEKQLAYEIPKSNYIAGESLITNTECSFPIKQRRFNTKYADLFANIDPDTTFDVQKYLSGYTHPALVTKPDKKK
ncbi:hypothetical protein IAI44_29650 [Bacillus cereus]|uniref:RelA/SpoT domain-containing protein n=1 Tax=Bacillus cereus TaxID=1396 RepID=UPI0035C6E5E9